MVILTKKKVNYIVIFYFFFSIRKIYLVRKAKMRTNFIEEADTDYFYYSQNTYKDNSAKVFYRYINFSQIYLQ